MIYAVIRELFFLFVCGAPAPFRDMASPNLMPRAHGVHSRAVTCPCTNHAQRSLAAVIGGESAFSPLTRQSVLSRNMKR